MKKTPTERREFVAEKKLCFGCFSDQHIAKTAKSCKKTCKLATSPTQRHCTITIGRRNQMVSAIRISLETNLKLAATAQLSATSLKREMYRSTWVYYQLSCFIKIIQPRRFKFMPGWTMLVAERLRMRSRQCHLASKEVTLVLSTIQRTCNVTTKAMNG